MRIGYDRWIGSENPTKPRVVLHDEYQHRCVSSLIDKEEKMWNHDLIEHLFHAEEVKKIKSIPLSSNLPEDKRIWRLTNHGFFTVKSAYHLAVKKFSQIHNKRPSSSEVAPEWKKLWHIDVIPRVKMFLWRACANALPTRTNLCQRGIEIDPMCTVCGEKEETVDHLFTECAPVAQVWYGTMLRIDVQRERISTFREWLWKKMNEFPPEYVGLFTYTVWEVWKRRNSMHFEAKLFNVHEVITRAFSQWSEFMDSKERSEEGERVRKRTGRWSKPRQGKYKINCDVAVIDQTRIGMGFAIRGDTGAVRLAGRKECLASGSSTLLEGLAMRFACQMANQYNVQVEEIESDCKVLTDTLTLNTAAPLYCDVILQDIRDLAMRIGCKSFSFIPRDGNKVAHSAARGPDFVSIRRDPRHLMEELAYDLLSNA